MDHFYTCCRFVSISGSNFADGCPAMSRHALPCHALSCIALPLCPPCLSAPLSLLPCLSAPLFSLSGRRSLPQTKASTDVGVPVGGRAVPLLPPRRQQERGSPPYRRPRRHVEVSIQKKTATKNVVPPFASFKVGPAARDCVAPSWVA